MADMRRKAAVGPLQHNDLLWPADELGRHAFPRNRSSRSVLRQLQAKLEHNHEARRRHLPSS